MRWAPLAVALALVLAGCGSSHGTLAFTSTRDGHAEVYLMRSDGSHVEDLTRNLAQDGQPSWSPDRARIAFVSTRSGNAQIYVMSADGTRQRRVTRSKANDMAPVWSPDGRKIAFMCTTATPVLVTEICVVNANGTGARRLTSPSEGDNLYPVWSNDSRIILCTRSQAGYSIHALRADGGGERLLRENGAEPAYAPEGKRVAFLTWSAARGRWLLEVARTDLTHAHLVLVGKGLLESPAWSPDGKRIAFVEGGDIHVVNADGSDERRLTSGPGKSLSPRWSPNGHTIAFERLRGSGSEVYVVGANGGSEKRLTHGEGRNGGPVWRP